MLADPIVSQKYDRTTNVNFVKVDSAPGTAKFVLSTNTSLDKVTMEIRYQTAGRKNVRYADQSLGITTSIAQQRANVKVTRETYNSDLGRWDKVSASVTYVAETHIDLTVPANLKDIIAYAALIPLTSAYFAKMLNEEV